LVNVGPVTTSSPDAAIMLQFRQNPRRAQPLLRVGIIDSAAIGLLPGLLQLFRQRYPAVEIQHFEDKTVHLLPKLKSGRLDQVFIRPPAQLDASLAGCFCAMSPAFWSCQPITPLPTGKGVISQRWKGCR